MNYERWVDPRVRSVRVAGVRNYLLDHGWHLRPFPRPELLVFELPSEDEGDVITQVLPADERSVDYTMRCVDLITSVSALEDRHPVAVLNDILNQGEASQPGAKDGNGTAALAPGEPAAPR